MISCSNIIIAAVEVEKNQTAFKIQRLPSMLF